MGAGTRTWDGVQGSAVIVVGQKRHCFRLGPLRLKKQPTGLKINPVPSIQDGQLRICETVWP